jgi:hypothetical protein
VASTARGWHQLLVGGINCSWVASIARGWNKTLICGIGCVLARDQ